jgi:hypothetical protein
MPVYPELRSSELSNLFLNHKTKAMTKLKVRSIYPENQPSYNEWCEEFKFGTRYQKREGIENANRIMELWDSYMNTKEKFIRLTENIRIQENL